MWFRTPSSSPSSCASGELTLGIALILGLLTNLAAIGSVGLSVVILLSQGGVGLGTGLGAPEFLTDKRARGPASRW